jgi:hypothetical protein
MAWYLPRLSIAIVMSGKNNGCDPPVCRMARGSVFNPHHTPLRRLRLTNPALRSSQRKIRTAQSRRDGRQSLRRLRQPTVSTVGQAAVHCPPSPGGTAEALSEDVFHPTLQDWIREKACFPTTVNQGTQSRHIIPASVSTTLHFLIALGAAFFIFRYASGAWKTAI